MEISNSEFKVDLENKSNESNNNDIVVDESKEGVDFSNLNFAFT